MFSEAAFAIKGFEQRGADERLVRDIEQLSSAIRQVYEDRGLTERHSDAFRGCHIERNGKLCEVLRVFDRIYFDPNPEEIFIAQAGRQLPGYPAFHVEELLKKIHSMTKPLHRACLAASIYHNIVKG